MKYPFGIFLVVVSSTMALPIWGIQSPNELDAYCSYLEGASSLSTLETLTPTLTSSYYRGGEATTSTPLNPSLADYNRYRIGLEYDLINIFQFSTRRKLYSASCTTHRALAALDAVRELSQLEERLLLITAMQAGIASANRILNEGITPLLSARRKFQSKLKQGSATVSEALTANESYLAVKQQLNANNSELDRLARLEREIQQDLIPAKEVGSKRSMSGPSLQQAQDLLNETQKEEQSLKDREALLKNFQLALSGGYQHLSGAAVPSAGGGSYVGIQLKVNLGALGGALFHDSISAYDTWLKTRVAKPAVVRGNMNVTERIGYLTSRLDTLKGRLGEAADFLTGKNFGAASLEGFSLSTKVYSSNLLASAEEAAVGVELSALKSGVVVKTNTFPNSIEAPPPAPVETKVRKPLSQKLKARKPNVTAQTKFQSEVKAAEKVEVPNPQATETDLPMRSKVQNYRYTQPATHPKRARLKFVYQGEMANPKKLGSGEIRHQLGVMLLQQNQCNLVYVMLRLDGSLKLAVQEKVNAGASTHQECGNKGYLSIKGKSVGELPHIATGTRHELGAEITESGLLVWLDGRLVWQGSVPEKISTGVNIGFRSDNVDVEFGLSDSEFTKAK